MTAPVETLFAGADALGPVSVVASGGVRSLHFGTAARQSAIDLAEPRALVLHSARRIAAALLLAPIPRRALLLGLGGGSLAKFLLETLDCAVDAVERRPLVVEAARRFFALPDDPRLRVLVGDAAELVHALPPGPGYDLVIVDLYNGTGADAAASQAPLFAACRARMRERGVLAFNLWREEAAAHLGPASGFARAFAPPHLAVHTANGNVVCFGGVAPLPGMSPALIERALEITTRTGLDCAPLLSELIHFNPEHFLACSARAPGCVEDAGEQVLADAGP